VSGTFQRTVLCVRSADEPSYKFLTDRFKATVPKGHPVPLEVYENGEVPDVGAYKGESDQTLVTFDDLTTLTPRQQTPTVDWFTRGRKAAGGCSLVYTTQSYWRTPRTVRLNLSHTTLKRLSSKKDLHTVLRDHGSLGDDKAHTELLYERATAGVSDFFLTTVGGLRGDQFRRNFFEKLE
jgi:hypothetical protein